jgi:hypothetical protein
MYGNYITSFRYFIYLKKKLNNERKGIIAIILNEFIIVLADIHFPHNLANCNPS